MIADTGEAAHVIEEILQFARPFLQTDGGNVELVSVTNDDIIRLRFLGACATCPITIMTYQAGFERLFREHYPQARVILIND